MIIEIIQMDKSGPTLVGDWSDVPKAVSEVEPEIEHEVEVEPGGSASNLSRD